MESDAPEAEQEQRLGIVPHQAADQVVVPNRGQLTILCEQARADGTLRDLREQLAALFSVGERFGVVYSELVRLAVAKIDPVDSRLLVGDSSECIPSVGIMSMELLPWRMDFALVCMPLKLPFRGGVPCGWP